MNEKMKQNYELAEVDYIAGMKYKDIAVKYEVSINTVKSWKTRYKWSKDKKGAHTKRKKVCVENKIDAEKEEVIAEEVNQVIENPDLNDKQRLFCLYYIKSFNATKAYQKAYECSYETAMVRGCELLRNVKIQEEIKGLKQGRLNKAMLEPEDIFGKYMQIAFADMNDQADVSGSKVSVRADYDGTIVSEVAETKTGIKIKLNDRMKALQWLTDHSDMGTEEQRARVESLRNKVKIENEILELRKKEFERNDW